MPDLHHVTVYVHAAGPNPFKVLIVLEELGIPYKKVLVEDPKEEWFTLINPNGRLPAIADPNTGTTLWESGAIMEYLVETYDREGRLSAASVASRWQIKQYLHFQMSGQGPYYGQAMWFHKCPDDIPIAKQRYLAEMARVISVLDSLLQGKKFLVDDKLTYADLAFVPWNKVAASVPFFTQGLWDQYNLAEKYPAYIAWQDRLNNLTSVKRAYE